jgi:hypothetical protein
MIKSRTHSHFSNKSNEIGIEAASMSNKSKDLSVLSMKDGAPDRSRTGDPLLRSLFDNTVGTFLKF